MDPPSYHRSALFLQGSKVIVAAGGEDVESCLVTLARSDDPPGVGCLGASVPRPVACQRASVHEISPVWVWQQRIHNDGFLRPT